MNINCTQLNTIYVYREQQVLSRLYILCDKLIENNELPCRGCAHFVTCRPCCNQNSKLRNKGDTHVIYCYNTLNCGKIDLNGEDKSLCILPIYNIKIQGSETKVITNNVHNILNSID